jgi:hypothetical protein
MFTFKPGLMAGAALSAALLAGCGGNNNDDHGASGGGAAPPGPVAQTITDVVAYINSLITGSSDSAEPVDTNLLTLVVDDGSEPALLP